MVEQEKNGDNNGSVGEEADVKAVVTPTEPPAQYHPALLGLGIKVPADTNWSEVTKQQLDAMFKDVDREGLAELREQQRKQAEDNLKYQTALAGEPRV